MDPFGTGQTLPPLQLPQTPATPATVNPLKKPPKWIRRPVGASFAVSSVSLSSDQKIRWDCFYFLSTLEIFFDLFPFSLVGSWYLWRIQNQTPSSLSSPLLTLCTWARLLQKPLFWSAPTSCRPLWVQVTSWTSARKRSTWLKMSLKKLFGLSLRYEETLKNTMFNQ